MFSTFWNWIKQGMASRQEKSVLLKLSDILEVDGKLSSYDPTLLDTARTQWQLGEWAGLVKIVKDELEHHPERARLALMVSSAHQQLGRHEEARNYLRLAQEWGCDKKLMAQVMIAGVHNSLGIAAAINKEQPRSLNHFNAAVVAGTTMRERESIQQVRAARELARVGLLVQASSHLEQQFKTLKNSATGPNRIAASVKVLESQIQLLQSELSLSQRRGQLYTGKTEGQLSVPDSDKSEWIKSLKKKATSQLGQDMWVLEKTGYKRGGFFVEFGATDGVMLSNTWLLEQEFGWQGICAEPNPTFNEKLQKNRNCIVSNACIGSETGREVDFILAEEFGGIAEFADLDMHVDLRMSYATMGKVTRFQTVSLHDFLVQNNAPQEIDYMSIDTEGSELEILSMFDFNHWNIRLITVEHNYTPQRAAIRALLEKHGYRCTEQEWDDWYVCA